MDLSVLARQSGIAGSMKLPGSGLRFAEEAVKSLGSAAEKAAASLTEFARAFVAYRGSHRADVREQIRVGYESATRKLLVCVGCGLFLTRGGCLRCKGNLRSLIGSRSKREAKVLGVWVRVGRLLVPGFQKVSLRKNEERTRRKLRIDRCVLQLQGKRRFTARPGPALLAKRRLAAIAAELTKGGAPIPVIKGAQ